ncbi:MAG: hypothetical protein Q4D21_08270 [Phascolarctobacterium sp.]|nr:hypothetical protein [Phascolarctobacterium sp.]
MKTIKLIVALIIVLSLGAAMGRQVSDWARGLGSRHHFTKNDLVYLEPSLTSTELVTFDKGVSNKILDRIKMEHASAVVMREDLQYIDKENVKYFLNAGDTYRLSGKKSDDKLKVNVEITTKEGKSAIIPVAKKALTPVDEGEWILVRNEKSKEGWVRVKSNW